MKHVKRTDNSMKSGANLWSNCEKRIDLLFVVSQVNSVEIVSSGLIKSRDEPSQYVSLYIDFFHDLHQQTWLAVNVSQRNDDDT